MKTITRSKIHLAMATIILAATLVVPAAAQNLVPFKGALQGNDMDGVLNFPVLPLHTEGFGFERYIHSVAFRRTAHRMYSTCKSYPRRRPRHTPITNADGRNAMVTCFQRSLI